MAREIERLKVSGKANASNTYADFVLQVWTKYGKSYGWKAAFITASQTDSRCRAVTSDIIRNWQRADKVPEWALSQLQFMTLNHPLRKKLRQPQDWTAGEKQFLIDLFLQNRQRTNKFLAHECTMKFGRVITVPAVKGQLDRQAKLGQFTFELAQPAAVAVAY